MKNILKIIFSAVLLMTFFGGVASAQTLKVATVDMGKVFTNYYKFKLAQANLDDQKNRMFKDENDMVENLKTGDTEYKALLASASDQALSADERDKKKQAADAKLKQLQDSKAALDEYDRSAKTRLTDQLQRLHDKILAEIQDAVTAKAKVAGYNLVIDSGAQSAGVTPVVVYNSGQNDLTADVIKQLNIGAPIDLNVPATSIAPSMINTNAMYH